MGNGASIITDASNDETLSIVYDQVRFSDWIYMIIFDELPFTCNDCKVTIEFWEDLVLHCYHYHDSNIRLFSKLQSTYLKYNNADFSISIFNEFNELQSSIFYQDISFISSGLMEGMIPHSYNEHFSFDPFLVYFPFTFFLSCYDFSIFFVASTFSQMQQCLDDIYKTFNWQFQFSSFSLFLSVHSISPYSFTSWLSSHPEWTHFVYSSFFESNGDSDIISVLYKGLQDLSTLLESLGLYRVFFDEEKKWKKKIKKSKPANYEEKNNNDKNDLFDFVRYVVNASNDGGITANHVAASLNDALMLNLLLFSGADPLRTDMTGSTPLHYAVKNGCFDTSIFLIENAYESVHICNFLDETPLHSAIKNNYENIAFELLQSASDPSIKNLNGETALDLCKNYGMADLATVCKKYEKKYNKVNFNFSKRGLDIYYCELGKEIEAPKPITKERLEVIFAAFLEALCDPKRVASLQSSRENESKYEEKEVDWQVLYDVDEMHYYYFEKISGYTEWVDYEKEWKLYYDEEEKKKYYHNFYYQESIWE